MPDSESFFTESNVLLSAEFNEITVIPSQGYSLLAKAKRYGRWWLLKGLKDDYRSQTIYQAFLQKEYNILCQMQHPQVVSAFSFEQVEGIGCCIVMEWIDGMTLKQWLQSTHSLKERRAVALMLLEAVDYIHSLQIAHRDLKPSNIMVTTNGRHLKLIDFGLSDTQNYAILKSDAGTKGYMAPDGPSDIYSLGIILKELRLGLLSKLVIRRCIAPRAQRISNVASLLKALQRCWTWPRRFAFALFALLLIAILFTTIINNVSQRQKEKILAVETALSDSLDRVKAYDQLTSDSLNRRIHELESERQTIEQQAILREQLVSSIKVAIDKEVKTSKIESLLDTAHTRMDVGLWPTKMKEKLWQLIEERTNTSASHLSDDDQILIKAQLQDYVKTRYTDRWQQRYAALPLY